MINKKAKQRRFQNLLNQHTRVLSAEAHLQQWVQRAGEEEVHTAARKAKKWEPLAFHKRQPLTIDDYLQEKESEQLRKQ